MHGAGLCPPACPSHPLRPYSSELGCLCLLPQTDRVFLWPLACPGSFPQRGLEGPGQRVSPWPPEKTADWGLPQEAWGQPDTGLSVCEDWWRCPTFSHRPLVPEHSSRTREAWGSLCHLCWAPPPARGPKLLTATSSRISLSTSSLECSWVVQRNDGSSLF